MKFLLLALLGTQLLAVSAEQAEALRFAHELLTADDAEGALAELEGLDMPQAHLLRGHAHLSLKQPAKAQKAFSQALAAPVQLDALRGLVRTSSHPAAASLLLLLQPDDQSTRQACLRLVPLPQAAAAAKTASEHLQIGYRALASGDTARMTEHLQTAWLLGTTEAALPLAHAALAESPGHARWWLAQLPAGQRPVILQAEIAERLNEREHARALALPLRDHPSHASRAIALLARTTQTPEDEAQLATYEPQIQRPHLLYLGDLAAAQQRFKQAIRWYQFAQKQGPLPQSSHRYLIQSYLQLEEQAAAEQALIDYLAHHGLTTAQPLLDALANE